MLVRVKDKYKYIILNNYVLFYKLQNRGISTWSSFPLKT